MAFQNLSPPFGHDGADIQIDDLPHLKTNIPVSTRRQGASVNDNGLYHVGISNRLQSDSYRDDPEKKGDTRWVHRPAIDWQKAARRNTPGSIEYKIFSALKRMIAVRKEIAVFADFNNRELLDVQNPHLFVFGRYPLHHQQGHVLVVANFNSKPQHLAFDDLGTWKPRHGRPVDLYKGESPDIFNRSLVIPGFSFYWLEVS